jgi:hypothetical protein
MDDDGLYRYLEKKHTRAVARNQLWMISREREGERNGDRQRWDQSIGREA